MSGREDLAEAATLLGLVIVVVAAAAVVVAGIVTFGHWWLG